MMRRESLRIVEPCSADWERMDGDGAVRFCRLCHKDVHDLSQMGEDEARAFLASGDQPCIRYRYDARGEVRFADRAASGLLPRIAAAAALTLAGLAGGGCLMGKRACDPPDRGEQAKPEGEPQPAAPAETPAGEQPAATAGVAD